VVVQAVRDETSERVALCDQRTPPPFLAGREGQALLAAVGIPVGIMQALVGRLIGE